MTIFTTRPDTIMGATFVAISYENPLIKSVILKEDNMIDCNAYENYLAKLERMVS